MIIYAKLLIHLKIQLLLFTISFLNTFYYLHLLLAPTSGTVKEQANSLYVFAECNLNNFFLNETLQMKVFFPHIFHLPATFYQFDYMDATIVSFPLLHLKVNIQGIFQNCQGRNT